MIFARPNGDNIEIRFKAYMDEAEFKEVVDRIKRIEGRRFHGNNGNSYWTVPISEQSYLKKLFDRKEIEWEDEIIDIPIVARNISTDTTFLDELLHAPYPFQAIGINFLCDAERCMLADEMGLGKTIQIMGAIYKLYRQGKIKKALIVCPSTLKYEWETQMKFFFDMEKYKFTYQVIDGDPSDRVEMYENIKKNDVLFTIINYELVLRDSEALLDLGFDVVALDEAHRIKDWKSETSKAIKKFKTKYRWAATGTPMQNKPEELFNIFSWIDESILGNWWKFRSTHVIIGRKFGQNNMVLGYKKLGLIHQKIAPYMLRRLKKDVAPNLPEMIITNRYVDMYPEQLKLHEGISDELYELLKEISKYTERDENGNIIKQHPKANLILGFFVMMQEICDTPALLEMSDSKMAQKYVIKKNASPKLEELMRILEEFMESKTKEEVGDDLIEQYNAQATANANTPKVVIFTQFARMQALIVERIKRLGGVETINGSMSAAQKQEHMVNFKFNKDINFIVCTDSANYGVNLQEASLLINFDLPWNPAIWAQRNARIHRLNSTHESVQIINLIAKEGLDERILDVLYNKQDMAHSIVENREHEKEHLSALTQDVMRKLLRKKKKKKKGEEDEGSD